MNNIHIPTRAPSDWAAFLAEPERQWRAEYSAYELAMAWEAAAGFPPNVASVLSSAPNDIFRDLRLLVGLVEHKVPLPGRGWPSQTDLWILARTRAEENVSIAVEGKVEEPFDLLVKDWLAKDNGPSEGKRTRLPALCDIIGLNPRDAGELRYQLVHRTAAALIEARRFGAAHAVMLVHSFSPRDTSFSDYARFARALRQDSAPEIDAVVSLGQRDREQLFVAWVKDAPSSGPKL